MPRSKCVSEIEQASFPGLEMVSEVVDSVSVKSVVVFPCTCEDL